MHKYTADVLIIGGGAAGLSLALHLSNTTDCKITILCKDEMGEGSSLYAQGGISAVLDKSDSFASHIDDTLVAGAGLCKESAVKHVVENAPNAIQWLINNGVEFTVVDGDEYDGVDGNYHLTREGGHSHRRVIHADDATGKAVTTTLEKLVKQQDNITILENHIAIDLITADKLSERSDKNHCFGAYALNKDSNTVHTFSAKITVLATGGASKAYLYTSNPDSSTGDGIAMAWRAGCRIANMEFVQFHPTCLYHPHAKSSLISEAVRGEGGTLHLPDGTRFMEQHHEQKELAPRDIVARAIDYEMKKHGLDSVFLDISHKPAEFVMEHFPNIHENCMQYGIDITKGSAPVVPAAHYTCGGVITDLNGRTDIRRLYAIGETSCTGLHGANRLASNSLLECLVLGKSAANDIQQRLQNKQYSMPSLPSWDASRVSDPDEQIVVSHNWDEIRRFMWDYVGIVRTNKRLQRALNRVNLLKEEIQEYYSNFTVNSDLIELRNLVNVAELTVKCALKRKESRGLHYTTDYPQTKNIAKETILTPENFTSYLQISKWE
ncbi:MAG: L-aspartate oxidase [Arenicella sp.]